MFPPEEYFNMTNILPHNLLQTNPCIRHKFAGVQTLAGNGRFFFNTEPLG
jgi:hypothetical protein